MKKQLYLFIFLFSLNSCKKKEFSIQNLNGNTITVLGHGGMGIDSNYPMNSYEAILKCLNLGADGTEFDVQMTMDSVLVLYHSEDLSDETNIKGKIHSMNWNEVKHAIYNETPYLKYSIRSLDQIFEGLNDLHNYQFTFDCKLYTNSINLNLYYRTYINAVLKTLKKYQIQNKVYIESSIKDFLTMFRNINHESKLFINPPNFETGLSIASTEGFYGITISNRNITQDQIRIAHANQLRVAVWNVHSRSDNIEAVKKNPDFIQTDNVKSLVRLLK